MDFSERLLGAVNGIPNIPVRCKLGYLDDAESFVLYSLPGGRKVREYYDGTSDQQLNFEFAMKSKKQSLLNETLWKVADHLENLKELTSSNDTFEFQDLIITNKPFINAFDDQGWFVFLLDVQANITVFKEEK